MLLTFAFLAHKPYGTIKQWQHNAKLVHCYTALHEKKLEMLIQDILTIIIYQMSVSFGGYKLDRLEYGQLGSF